MTMDHEMWVGQDEHFGLASHERPDAPKSEHWSLEAIAAVERPHHAVVSPDGETVSYILDRDTSDVWTVSVAGGAPRRITVKRDLRPFWEDAPATWSPDGNYLACTAAGGVWVVAVSGGEARRVIDGGGPRWLDDNTLVVRVDHEGEDRLARVSIADPWAEPLTPKGQNVSGYRFTADRSAIVYVNHPRDDRKRSGVWLSDLETRETRLLSGHPAIRHSYPTPSPDGRVVAFASEMSAWNELHAVAIDGGEETKLTNDDADFSSPSWHADGDRLVAVRTRRGRSDLVIVDYPSGETTVLAPGGDWSSPGWAGDSVVAIYEDHRVPASLVRVDPDGSVTRLTGPPPAQIEVAPHVHFEEVTYESFDGLEIHGFLFKPAAARRGPVPAVVYPHGGPTSAYTDAWDGHAQYFIDKGYAWFAINFRGSTGYGRDFERANHGVWGVDDTEDCLAAADYLASLDWVDGDRIAIFGASYGSYMALASLARDPKHRFACGIAKYGDSDIATSWATGDRAGREDLERMMGSPAEARAAYREGSPLWQVANIERPLLIAHGERDARVHPGQSTQLVEELRRLQKAFEYVTYPTEAHGLLRAAPQIHFYRRLERFLDWHLM